MTACPNCGSERHRRGGNTIWSIYMALIAAGLGAVLFLRVNAAIVAGIMLAVIVIAHLVLDTRVCLDCGTQWKPPGRR